ncbi:tetratricopeptide repeat protein [Holosporaceae bacterium 'Namur']|nr:tetratricopeptide repeat protein [Holosporaceae bacterium 'Namur']
MQLSQVSKEFSKAGKLNKYLIIEQRYAAELRKLVYDYTLTPSFEIAINLIEVYRKLGDLYIDIGRISNKAEDYTDAAVFYQYVLSMVEKLEEEQKAKTNQELENYKVQAFEQLDIIWRELRELVYISANREITSQLGLVKHESEINRDFLKQLRMDAESKIQEIDEGSLKKEETESVYESEEYFINETRGLFEHIAEQVKGFIARIFKECEEVIGKPPCKYSVIGLGSLALNQFTPYSDLEFAILTENKDYKINSNPKIQNYFKNLSHLVHFKVICLGETIIPTSKYNINLERFISRGFNFDLGGKTPLGRIEKDKDYKLIQTPEKMAEYLDEKYARVDKNLPYILEASCFIYGEQSLFTNYRKKVSKYLNKENEDNVPNFKLRTLKRLKDGVEEHKRNELLNQTEVIKVKSDIDVFRLELIGSENEGKLVDVKQEIYRLPDRFIYSLALFFGIGAKSVWDAVDKLYETKIIACEDKSKNALHYLKYAASFAVMLRLRTYLANKGQFETMSTMVAKSPTTDESFKIFYLTERDISPEGGLFKYYYIALALHKTTEEVCLEENHEKQKNILRGQEFYNDSAEVKGKICLKLMKYNKALEYLEPYVNKVFNSFIENESNMHLGWDIIDLKGLLTLLGNAYSRLGRFKEQQETYGKILAIDEKIKLMVIYSKSPKKNEFLKSIEFIITLNDIGLCFNLGASALMQSQYNEAEKYFYQALDRYTLLNNKYPEKKEPILKSAETLCELGTLYLRQFIINPSEKLLKNAEEKFMQAERLYNQFALITNDKILKVTNYTFNIGNLYLLQKKYDRAELCFKEALSLLKEHYGVLHPDVIKALIALSDLYNDIGQHEQSEFILKKALNDLKPLEMQSTPHIHAKLLHNLGNTLIDLEKYLEAQKILYEARKILLSSYDEKHEEVGCTTRDLIRAIVLQGNLLLSQGNNPINYYQEAMLLYNKYYGDKYDLQIKKLNANETVLITCKSSLFEFCAVSAFKNNKLDEAIKCYEAGHKLFPNNIFFKYRLACCYHIKGMNLRSNGNSEASEHNITKSKEFFESLVDSYPPPYIPSYIHTEYAMLLIKHHNSENRSEYQEIKDLLYHAISIKEENYELLYCQQEKIALIEILREFLKEREILTITKPYILAYYLLIKVHHMQNEINEAKKELMSFAKEIMSVKKQEAEIPLKLLIATYKELGFEFQARIYEEMLIRTLGTVQEGLEKY